uniref:RNA helicase n=1 Tax=Macrocentrus cingulum TaxID=535359 RepID=H2CPB7_9HYME|nr:vasa-B [Macrocentrus cingulum]AGU28210.1 vasa-s [Macrocentrus cingulum]
MAEWEDDFAPPPPPSSNDEGRGYSKGRGFTAAPVKNPGSNSDWDNEPSQASVGDSQKFSNPPEDDWGQSKTQESGWVSEVSDNTAGGGGNSYANDSGNWGTSSSDNRGRGRGGRGGGGRGGRRDDSGWSSRNDDGNGGDSAWGSSESRDYNSDNRGRGRGGGRGGRRDDENSGWSHGGGGDNNGEGGDANGGEDGEAKRAPVTYVPPEIEDSEEAVFGSGIQTGINFEKYDSIDVKTSGEGVIPPPGESFESMGLRGSLLSNIQKSGYTKPTPVQKYSVPIIMGGRDLMACAQTGSGKTAAYLLPIINKLLDQNAPVETCDRGCMPQVIIMAPTRELVSQICNEAQKFARDTIIKSTACYGGVQTMYQVNKLRNGSHIIVASPGRLNDFIQRGRIMLEKIQFIVLDEADRMLDSGFLKDMESVLEHNSITPAGERQTLMFSATFDREIQNLAARFLRNYVFLTVGIVGGACADVEQVIYEVAKSEKRKKLQELLENDGGVSLKAKTLVFVETKRTADFIAAYMSDNHYPSTSIHGDREQRERETALGDFRSGRRSILVATSVAARGLDIQGVAHVINYDLPKSIDEYVHRIGRTGRVGNRGRATSFYDSDQDSAITQDLVRILTQAGHQIPDFLDNAGGGFSGGRGNDFGGYDIRNDYASGNGTGGGNVEPEEIW